MSTELNSEWVGRHLERLYHASGAECYFEKPFFAVASAEDPWFEKFKTVIGEFHWTPQEALALTARGALAKSVIVWILPVKAETRAENAKETVRPAVSWAAMRSFGEQTNENIRRQFCRLLEEEGYHAAAPHLEQLKRGFDIVKMNFTSHWSERHVAFVAGLGTFGLSAGLITERGIAMRVGSVVTDLELPPTPRPYGDDPFAWCTRCGACARRCPAHAIGKTNAERDKPRCAAYIVNHVSPDRGSRYGWYDLALGCGLCQTAVPCEFHRP